MFGAPYDAHDILSISLHGNAATLRNFRRRRAKAAREACSNILRWLEAVLSHTVTRALQGFTSSEHLEGDALKVRRRSEGRDAPG